MSHQQIVFSVLAEDRPGVVSSLAEVVKSHGGNWLESNFSKLRGHFAGIVHIELDSKNLEALKEQLILLDSQGIHILLNKQSLPSDSLSRNVGTTSAPIKIEVEANDREGIVEEITSLLAKNDVNVESFETCCESAAMAGYAIFKALLVVNLPPTLNVEQLETRLESLSDDLMVAVKQ